VSVDDTELTDVSDMPLMHQGFRRGLGEARTQLSFIEDGDMARAAHFADYISELLWLLHAHHDGEDELLYPLLVERVPDQADLFARMDAQHSSVESSVGSATAAAATYRDSGSATDARALADACEALLALLEPHLTEEEEEVLPLAARCVTPGEWGQLPGHALMAYRGDRIWLPFGLATEAFPPPVLDAILSGPSPIGPMWRGGGSAAFAQEMRLIRDKDAWTTGGPPG
jgi:hemerythrin-like domain-containing protein